MPANTNVSKAADLLRAQIRELDAERSKLERALANLTDGREGRRGPGRPKGAATAGGGRRRRRRRGGTRAEQAVKLIGDNPGITASEIARQLKIKPNYMYRVLSELVSEGRVNKSGRGYSA